MAIYIYEITNIWGEVFEINFLAETPGDAEATAKDFPDSKGYRLLKVIK